MAMRREAFDPLADTRATLVGERLRLLTEAAALAGRERELTELEGAGSDDADQASGLFEKELAAMLGQSVRAHLMDIDAALSRIDTGTYGNCEACGQPINPERLEALPRARRCVDCQRHVEFKARH